MRAGRRREMRRPADYPPLPFFFFKSASHQPPGTCVWHGKSRRRMVYIQKRVQCFFRLPKQLVEDFDKCIARMGYANRSEAFTAFAYSILELNSAEEEEPTFRSAACFRQGNEGRPALSERQIQQKLRETIDSLLKPVIACRGVTVACESGWSEVQGAFHEETGIWLTEDEIREGFYLYDLLNKPKLRDYALSVLHQKEGGNI